MITVPQLSQFETLFHDPLWIEIGKEICRRHGLSVSGLHRSERGESVVLLIDDRYVLKIFKPSKKGFEREKAALEFVSGKSRIPVPVIVAAVIFEGFQYLITTQIRGELMTRPEWLNLDKSVQLNLLEQLACGLREIHELDAEWMDFEWSDFVRHKAETSLERLSTEGGNPEWIEGLPRFIDDNLHLLANDRRQKLYARRCPFRQHSRSSG